MINACAPEHAKETIAFVTACNPMDLNYRFCLDLPSRREAADPTIVRFKNEYFLFASKSGGYWHSPDLRAWSFIETSEIPTEEYAPTAVVIDSTMYFLASSNEKSTIYKSYDPFSGKWTIAKAALQTPVWDPAFLLDDDKRLYLFWGCSDVNPIHGVELDYKHDFAFIDKPIDLLHGNPIEHGWEAPGDDNTLTRNPWIEGAWVNKHNNTYYLQYAGPGTEFKSYSDGVYVSPHPLGPYTLQAHNPFAYKPDGFAAGAGHGSTVEDVYGNFWHIGTMTISQKHMFERRLGLFPAFFDSTGTLHAATQYGDYPYIIPDKKVSSFEDLFPGWMLLSYQKDVAVSSSIDSLPPSHLTDENIRTYWSAKSGNAGEYVKLNLGNIYNVHAVQVNFAEHNTTALGRLTNLTHQYVIEHSHDGVHWWPLIDQSKNNNDNTHAYFQLPEGVSCQFIRVTNIKVPNGTFAISGLRVFGKGHEDAPDKVKHLSAVRNETDKRVVTLEWEKSNATGYVINYGVDPKQLYQHYMVYGNTSVTIHSLDVNQKYYFSIEAFNENGKTPNEQVVEIQ